MHLHTAEKNESPVKREVLHANCFFDDYNGQFCMLNQKQNRRIKDDEMSEQILAIEMQKKALPSTIIKCLQIRCWEISS